MKETIKRHAGEWGPASAAAVLAIAVWLALGSRSVHVHLTEFPLRDDWPASWPQGLLLMSSFVVGLVAMMVPCVLQMAVVFTATTAAMSASRAEQSAGRRPSAGDLAQTGLFMLGYVAFYSSLGIVLGVFGQGLATQGAAFLVAMRLAGGALTAALGLHLLGAFELPIGSRCRGPAAFLLGIEPKGRLGSLRAGIAFATFCVGCCGPYILAILIAAAASGSLLFSSAFLLAFSLGMAVPFGLIVLSHHFATGYLHASARRLRTVSRVSGTLLAVFGVLMALASGLS